jgi:recombination associated protein RdgC
MELKLFKSFTPYHNAPGADRQAMQDALNDTLYKAATFDPSAHQWTTIGFAPLVEHHEHVDTPEDFWVDLDGAALMCMVQFNQRVLPASVTKEKINARVADIEHRNDRKVTRKEYAEIRDLVEADLLPKAFIRRSFVPVMFIKDKVFVFTSSAKKADDIMILLMNNIPTSVLSPFTLSGIVHKSPDAVLTDIAKAGCSEDMVFATGAAAVLKGPNKQVVRIKDKDIQSNDVQTLLTGDYSVSVLGLNFDGPDNDTPDTLANFNLNSKLVMTGTNVAGVATDGAEQDAAAQLQANIYLIARTVYDLTVGVVEVMGGISADKLALAEKDMEPEPTTDDLVHEIIEVGKEIRAFVDGVKGAAPVNFVEHMLTADELSQAMDEYDPDLDGDQQEYLTDYATKVFHAAAIAKVDKRTLLGPDEVPVVLEQGYEVIDLNTHPAGLKANAPAAVTVDEDDEL